MKKFIDKSYIKYINNNPKGKKTSDCIVRALSSLLDKDYEVVYRELFELSLKTGYFINDARNYIKYVEINGYTKMPQPKRIDNTKYTGEEFCNFLKSHDNTRKIFAHIGGQHCVAIIDNCIQDIWECSQGCIGNYWIEDIK